MNARDKEVEAIRNSVLDELRGKGITIVLGPAKEEMNRLIGLGLDTYRVSILAEVAEKVEGLDKEYGEEIKICLKNLSSNIAYTDGMEYVYEIQAIKKVKRIIKEAQEGKK